MATTASETQVQELYIAYFGRPADTAGLAFYADALDAGTTTINDIATGFSASTEAQAIIALGTDAFLTAMYQQAFGRAYDSATDGTFWADAINNGDTTKELAMVQILDGAPASGADATAAANKVAVAKTYTAAVSAGSKDYSGATAAAAAKAVLDAVTSAAATVTAGNAAAQTAVDALDTPATGVAGATTALTTGVDIVEGTTSNETITGTDITTGDLIVDGNSNDSDVLNLTLTGAQTAAGTITKIENINVELNAFAGFAFDASGTTGATITLSSSKLGFDGVASVTTGGANTITSGAGVTNLTAAITTGSVVAGSAVTALAVTGVTTGTVDTGSATTASVIAAAAGSTPTVTVNGDIALTLGTATNVAIVASADAVIALTKGAATTVTVTGAGSATVKGDLTGVTLTGASAVEHTAAAGDISGLGDTVTASSAGAVSVTVKDGQTVALTAATSSAVAGSTATDAVTVSTGIDMTGLSFATLASATVNATAALDIAGLALGTTDVTLNVAGDTTVSTGVTGTGDLAITGTGDVNITTGAGPVVDASGLTGALTYTSTVAATITGGSGANSITTANADTTVNGGAGDDVVDAEAVVAKIIAFTGGAGSNTLKLSGPTSTVVYDGSLGTDTIQLKNNADLTGATTTLVSVENLTVADAAAGAVVNQTATVSGAQAASFTSLAITGPATGTSDDTLALTVTATAAGTTDLSGLVVADTAAISTVIDGTNGGAQTIVGTNANDTIDAGTGTASVGNTLTGGAGDDVFVFADSDSIEASMTTISDYQAAAAASDNDQITLGQTTLVADSTTDVSAVGSIFTGATATINAVVTNGVLALSGLTADLALADTLAEMIDIVEAVVDGDTITGGVDVPSLAFEFGGNTYLAEFTETGIATDTYTTTSVIELTGTTGITAVSGTAAADTILIA